MHEALNHAKLAMLFRKEFELCSLRNLIERFAAMRGAALETLCKADEGDLSGHTIQPTLTDIDVWPRSE